MDRQVIIDNDYVHKGIHNGHESLYCRSRYSVINIHAGVNFVNDVLLLKTTFWDYIYSYLFGIRPGRARHIVRLGIVILVQSRYFFEQRIIGRDTNYAYSAYIW